MLIVYLGTSTGSTDTMAAASEAPGSPAISCSNSSASSCPVLQAWATSEVVLKRLCDKDLLVLNGKRLTRQTCTANRELLVPLMNLIGFLSDFEQATSTLSAC